MEREGEEREGWRGREGGSEAGEEGGKRETSGSSGGGGGDQNSAWKDPQGGRTPEPVTLNPKPQPSKNPSHETDQGGLGGLGGPGGPGGSGLMTAAFRQAKKKIVSARDFAQSPSSGRKVALPPFPPPSLPQRRRSRRPKGRKAPPPASRRIDHDYWESLPAAACGLRRRRQRRPWAAAPPPPSSNNPTAALQEGPGRLQRAAHGCRDTAPDCRSRGPPGCGKRREAPGRLSGRDRRLD